MRSLTDWFEIVWFRWKVVAVITAAVVALMALYLIFAPRTYMASASLYFDKAAPDALRADEGAGKQENPSLSTEANIVQSSKVTQHILEKMEPAKKKAYQTAWGSQAKSGAPFDDWMRQVLLNAIKVGTQDTNRVMTITATASNAKEAADIANAFASAYVETQQTLDTGPSQAAAKFLAQSMEGARRDVERAEAALSGFVKATGISNGGNLTADATQATSIAVQLAASKAAAAGSANMGGVIEQSVADAERTDAVQRLSTELSQKTAEMSDLEATYGPNHPKMLAATAELATIQQRLKQERKAATQAFANARAAQINAAAAAAAASAGQLQSAASAQDAKLVGMSSNLGKFATLQQDLTSAQQRYNDLSARASQAKLRGGIPLANISQLDTAKPPEGATTPKVGLLAMLSVLLGLALGAGVAILLEYLNPRVRTLATVEKLIGVPVVARLSLPRETPRLLADARTS